MSKTKIANMDDSVAEEAKVEAHEIVEKVAEAIEATEPEKIEEVKEEKPKKIVTPKKGKKVRSKKYLEVTKELDKDATFPLSEAIEMAQKSSYSKFDGSLEIHILTNIKNLRGLVTLPYISGKSVKILAFGKGAEESGADMVGDDAKLTELSKGKIDFDVLVTTPEWMPRLAALAKVLGPKGLMPNPKNGTITDDLKKAVSELQTGKTEYRTESNGKVMHLSLGKVSQPTDELLQNAKTLLTTIGKTKVKKVVFSPSMGAGIKVNLASL